MSAAGYHCRRCVRTFNSERSLAQHEDYSNSHRLLCEICPHCFEGFETVLDLHEHQVDADHIYLCRKCNNGFFTEHNLGIHMQKHNERIYPCKGWNCEEKFKTYPDLTSHYDANKCTDSAFTNENFRRVALDVDHDNRITVEGHPDYRLSTGEILDGTYCEYECSRCNYQTNSYHSIQAHIDSGVHSDHVFECKCCSKSFVKHSSWANHMESSSCNSPGWKRHSRNLEYRVRRDIDTPL